MKLKKIFRSGAYGLLLIAAGGCYEYPAPPLATMGDTYTQRKQDNADKLLDGITDLSLADAQRISIINNPTYISAYHAVAAARMRYYQSWGAYSPVVTASFSAGDSQKWTRHTVNTSPTPVRTESITTSTGVNANLLLFDGLAREFSVLIARHNFDYQKQLEADECRTLMRAVAYAYNTVLLSIENKRIAQEDRDFQESSLRDTELKYQAGTVPLSDVLNFQIAMNSAESNLVTADYQYETAVYALAVLMGYPEGTFPGNLKFPSDFKTNFSSLPSVDIYLDTALANRPDLKGYREQLEIARYQMYQTVSAYSPTVNAYFNMGYNTNLNRSSYSESSSPFTSPTRNAAHNYSESPMLGYGLTADWTIFNGLIRYNRMREYQANVAVAEFSVTAKWLEVVGEVRTAYANYIQSVKQTRIFEKTRDLSAQQRDLVDEGFKAGSTEVTRLNEAQRDLVEAETNLASSYINIQNAKAQLDAAVSANTAQYYLDPVNTPAGTLQNTPVPGLESEKVPAGSQQTAPAQAPEQSVIPGTEGPGNVSSQYPAPPGTDLNAMPKSPIVVVEPNQPAVPAIPADPAKVPEKQ